MPALRALALVLWTIVLPFSPAGAAQIHKCTINGTVTFQADPCPSGQVRRAPTVEQLNAERQKKLRPSGDSQALGASAPTAPMSMPTPKPTTTRCDGRTHCSQMTSCAEARYFLTHCPGVKMDGDRNGIPCEQQWCNR
jgi:hypothetical protein